MKALIFAVLLLFSCQSIALWSWSGIAINVHALLVKTGLSVFPANKVFDFIIRYMDLPPATGHVFLLSDKNAGGGGDNAGQSDSGEDEEDEEDEEEEEEGERELPGGDEDPPEDELSEGEEVITEWIGQFHRILAEIGEQLKKKKIKLILVFDLDGTLYRAPQYHSRNIVKVLTPAEILSLQQQWFNELSYFLKKFTGQVFLVYNTARSVVNRLKRSPTLKGWIDPAATYEKSPDGHRQIQFQPSWQSINLDGLPWMGIPEPDALISDTGRVIYLTGGLQSQIDSGRLAALNEAFNQYHRTAKEEVLKMRHQDFAKLRSQCNIHPDSVQHFVHVTGGRMLRRLFENRFYRSPRETVICPGINKQKDVYGVIDLVSGYSIYFSSVVNKGSSLSLLLELLQPVLEGDGTPEQNIWEVVFGDGCADIPMLRPDLEAQGLSQVPDELMRQRRTAYTPFGFSPDFQRAPYWQLSVVAGRDRLFIKHGAYVESVLTHDRVTDQRDKNLPGLFIPLLRKLRGD